MAWAASNSRVSNVILVAYKLEKFQHHLAVTALRAKLTPAADTAIDKQCKSLAH